MGVGASIGSESAVPSVTGPVMVVSAPVAGPPKLTGTGGAPSNTTVVAHPPGVIRRTLEGMSVPFMAFVAALALFGEVGFNRGGMPRP